MQEVCDCGMRHVSLEGACSSGRRYVFGGGINQRKGVYLCGRERIFVNGGVYLWERSSPLRGSLSFREKMCYCGIRHVLEEGGVSQ